MTNSELALDLQNMAEMASEMDAYLKSDVLFWNMAGGPRLTLGGYLMRQHRILALADELDEDEVAVLNTAVSQFNNAMKEKIVRFETKAHQEIEARLRQWSEFLSELKKDTNIHRNVYANGVKPRIMLSAIVAKLQTQPYKLESRVQSQIELQDRRLRQRWFPGDFVLADIWKEAYPQDEFWYLYGLPKESK